MSRSQASSITSSSYQRVSHKKNRGTVILTDASFTFYPAPAVRMDPTTGVSRQTTPHTSTTTTTTRLSNVVVVWINLTKHQVSPITHPRFLLKLVLGNEGNVDVKAGISVTPVNGVGAPANGSSASRPTSLTFELTSREELERIRRDISTRLTNDRRIQAQNAMGAHPASAHPSRKRRFDESGLNGFNGSSSSLTAAASAAASAGTGTGTGEPKSKLTRSQSFSSQPSSSMSFTALTDTYLAVTSASLLSNNSTLRMHYSLLVLAEPPPHNASHPIIDYSKLKLTNVLSRSDFWKTHQTMLAQHAAKIHGTVSYGLSSKMKSSLDLLDIGARKPIRLGVEEMRQIFILYPAVHKAYEAMVPLELSEEQFWRKYLESEYFHRDRGRINTHFHKRNTNTSNNNNNNNNNNGVDGKDDEQKELDKKAKKDSSELTNDTNSNNANSNNTNNAKSKDNDATTTQENARVAAASSSDIFSRAELELQKKKLPNTPINHTLHNNNHNNHNGVSLAIGQFDLAATAHTERGSKLLLYSNDPTRPNNEDKDTKGTKVIEKYNRHWAIVMNPEIATAGCNLMDLARESVHYVLNGDDDAKVAGGVGKEMERLVGFASASEGRVDHVKGLGDPEYDDNDDDNNHHHPNHQNNNGTTTTRNNGGGASSLFQDLRIQKKPSHSSQTLTEKDEKRDHRLDNLAMLSVLDSVMEYNTVKATEEGNSFPKPAFGSDLLRSLTKKMKEDSVTDSDTIKLTNQLDETFRKKLILYFQRVTELLKHFFALRQVMDNEKRCKKGSSTTTSRKSSEKIKKVVDCMKQVYREMDEMRNGLPEDDNTMRQMCFTIMKQLDAAFEGSRSSGSGDSGGFVTVGGGFVTVED